MRNGAYTKIPNFEQSLHSLQMKSRFDAEKNESEGSYRKPHKFQHGLLGFVALLLASAAVLVVNIFRQPTVSQPDFVRYLYYSNPRGGMYSQTFLKNYHEHKPMLRRNVARLIESQYTAIGALIDPACMYQSLILSNQESAQPNPQLNEETLHVYLQKLYRDAADEQMYGCLLNDLDAPPPVNWRSGASEDTPQFYMGHLPQDLSDPMPSSQYQTQSHCPTDFYGSYSTLDPYGVFNDTIPGQWFKLAADLPSMLLEPFPEMCTIKRRGQALKDALRIYLTTRISGIWMPPVVNTTGTPVGVLNSGRMVAIHEYAKVGSAEKPVDTSDDGVVADVEMVCSSLAALDGAARRELSKQFQETESWNEYMDDTLIDVLEVCKRAFNNAVKQLEVRKSDVVREKAQIQRLYVVSLLSMHLHIAYKKMYALQPPVVTGERVATWAALVKHVQSTDSQTPPLSHLNEYTRLPGVSRGEAVLFQSVVSSPVDEAESPEESENLLEVATPSKQDILDSGIIKAESARRLLEDRPDIFEQGKVCNSEHSVCVDVSVLLQIYQAPREVQRRAVRALGLGWGIMYEGFMVKFMQLALDMFYVRRDYAVSEVFLIGPPKTGSTAQFQCLAGAFHHHYACANDACIHDPSTKYWAHSPQNLGQRSIVVKEPRTVRSNLKTRRQMAKALQSPTMYSPKSKFHTLPAHPVDVDATTDYLHYPWAPLVMYFLAPDPKELKFGAVHRDPADRFFSHYSMRLRWKKNGETTVEDSFNYKLSQVDKCYENLLQARYAYGWDKLKQQYPKPENEVLFSDGPLGYPDAFMHLPMDIFLMAQRKCYLWSTLEVYASIYEFAYKNYFSLFYPSQLTVQEYQEEKEKGLVERLEDISEITGMYLNPQLVEELQAKVNGEVRHSQDELQSRIVQPIDQQDSFAQEGAGFKEGRPVDIDTLYDLCSSTKAMSFAKDDAKEQSQASLQQLRERYASHERVARDLLRSHGVL